MTLTYSNIRCHAAARV